MGLTHIHNDYRLPLPGHLLLLGLRYRDHSGEHGWKLAADEATRSV
jgi:ribonuclease BN (tRNA processing enzyme)